MSEEPAVAQKLPAHKDPARLWQKGVSQNPGGKPKGARNRLQGSFINQLADDFAAHGKQAIEDCRKKKPDKYLAVIASLMPKEIEISRPLDELTDEQLDAALDTAHAILAARGRACDGAGTADPEGQEPAAGLHPVPEAG